MTVRSLLAQLARRGHWRVAHFLSVLAPEPTDRAHLLLDPGPGDYCDAWTHHVVFADCEGDGHYLCRTCTRRIRGLESACSE